MSVVRQLRVSLDFVLLEQDLLWQIKSACVGWIFYVGSLELCRIKNWSLAGMQYGYGTLGNIVRPLNFAGALGPKFILMVDNDQLRRARGVRGFLGRD